MVKPSPVSCAAVPVGPLVGVTFVSATVGIVKVLVAVFKPSVAETTYAPGARFGTTRLVENPPLALVSNKAPFHGAPLKVMLMTPVDETLKLEPATVMVDPTDALLGVRVMLGAVMVNVPVAELPLVKPIDVIV